MGACDVHTAYKLVSQSFMKLVEEHQSRTSNSLKTTEVNGDIYIDKMTVFNYILTETT